MNSARKEKPKLREVERIVQYHTAKKFQSQDSNLVQSDSKTCAVPARFWSLQLPAGPKCSFCMLEIEREWWALCFSFLGDCGSLLQPHFLVHRGTGMAFLVFFALQTPTYLGWWDDSLWLWSMFGVLAIDLSSQCSALGCQADVVLLRGAHETVSSVTRWGFKEGNCFFFKGRQQGSKT